MPPILLHIYGPIAIHSFGAMIVIGLIVTLYLLDHDRILKKIITKDELATIIQISFFSGLIGGRIWFLITNPVLFDTWIEYISVWSGGLSILGAIIATILGLSIYCYYKKIDTLQMLDRLALYAPLLQAISRFGCFFAGCCYGKVTNLPWKVIYQDPNSLAPLHIPIHPTQIYSSICLFLIFIMLFLFDTYYKHKRYGLILALYIIAISIERFFVDFLRADQEFFMIYGFGHIPAQQILACFLCVIGLSLFIFITKYTHTPKNRL